MGGWNSHDDSLELLGTGVTGEENALGVSTAMGNPPRAGWFRENSI